MSPDAVGTDGPRDELPQRQNAQTARGPDLVRRIRSSSSWQMVLALAFVVIAAFGLCRIGGFSSRLTTLPAPSATPSPLPTATRVPTWTLSPTPEPTDTATPVPVVLPGVEAMVSGAGAKQLRLRVGPGLTYETLQTLKDGTHLTVLEGPEQADGYKWWRVQTDDGQEGWVAGDWLVPVTP